MCVFGKVSLSALLLVLSEHCMSVFGKGWVSALGGYWVGIACMYWVRFCCVFYDVYQMYVFGNVSLSVL